MEEALFYIAISVTLCFAFVNGFHDGGNVIATIICSRAMRPGKALVLAALAEFLGALFLGTAVAHTMSSNILKPNLLAQLGTVNIYLVIIVGVSAAIFWKIPSWIVGLPSSGSHALIGGLVGAGLVSMGQDGILFDKVVKTVVIPLLFSPVIGVIVGYVVFSVIRNLFARAHRNAGRMFTTFQKPIMVFLAASHGSNDAQKAMGVIAIVLAAAGGDIQRDLSVPNWVTISCAAALAVGLTAGGWRIVKTVGFGICRMESVHSFASQFTATSVVLVASLIGGPVSTTQVVASSVMGVGAAHRLSGVRWTAAGNIAYAWLLTVPVCAALGGAGYWCLNRIIGN